MTALSDFERLEATGLWRETEDAQRRDVYVFVGKSTLVIADKSEEPLSHWSLPAIERLNPGQRPALYAPAPDAGETLEIDDPLMIDAIQRVHKAVRRAEPHPGRLRWMLTGGVVAATLAAAVFWLPGVIARHTVSVLPEVQRAAIGETLFGHLTRLTGPACGGPEGARRLAELAGAVEEVDPPEVRVVRSGVDGSLMLPGRLVLLDRTLVEDHETADAAAGAVVWELALREGFDPLDPLLESVGLRETLRLLTTGQMSDAALEDYAVAVLKAPRPDPAPEVLSEAFAAARLNPQAFAATQAPRAGFAQLLPASTGDSQPEAGMILNDNSWVVLQSLCTG